MPARLIDDADSRVIKEGNWGVGGDPNDSYNGTLSYSVTVGDSMKLNFNGSYIAVFGLYDSTSEGVVTNYTIDGAPPARVTTPPATGDVPLQQFWVKKGLAPGVHTLQITMDKLNVEPNSTDQFSGTIWFDYFQVDNSNTDLPTVTQTIPTGFPQSTPSSSSDQSHGSHLPVGAIIGIVIGALFFLLGAAFLFLMWRRMQRNTRVVPSKEKRNSFRQSLIEPFLLSQHTSDPSTSSTQIAAAGSAERLVFNPSLLVRGPPGAGTHKSTIMSAIQNPDSAPSSAYPRPQSISASSSTSRGTLPPGAQPPTLPPVPHLPQHSSTRPTTAQSAITSTSHTSGQHPGSSADDALTITLVPSSPVGTAMVPDGEEETGSTSPRQHVDSGVREPGVILAHSVRQKRVELPPVYSPV